MMMTIVDFFLILTLSSLVVLLFLPLSKFFNHTTKKDASSDRIQSRRQSISQSQDSRNRLWSRGRSAHQRHSCNNRRLPLLPPPSNKQQHFISRASDLCIRYFFTLFIRSTHRNVIY